MKVVRPFPVKCTWHTEILVCSVVANKICALRGLPSHVFNDLTKWLDFLHRFSLFHEGVNVVHNLNKANDGILVVQLSQGTLWKAQIIMPVVHKKRALRMTDMMFQAILAYGWTWKSDRIVVKNRHVNFFYCLTSAIPSTSSLNNLIFCRSRTQVLI